MNKHNHNKCHRCGKKIKGFWWLREDVNFILKKDTLVEFLPAYCTDCFCFLRSILTKIRILGIEYYKKGQEEYPDEFKDKDWKNILSESTDTYVEDWKVVSYESINDVVYQYQDSEIYIHTFTHSRVPDAVRKYYGNIHFNAVTPIKKTVIEWETRR